MSEILQVSVLYTEFDGTLRPWAGVPEGACMPAISALNDLWRDTSDTTTPKFVQNSKRVVKGCV